MIETILSWILTAVGEGLEAMMDYLFGLLDLSPVSYTHLRAHET